MNPRPRNLLLAAAAAGLIAAAALWMAGVLLTPARADLARGEALYMQHCASCHGAALEGAPDWREPGPAGRLPAPPHDATGHTWHHGDAVLFRIVSDGTASVVGGGYESDMPGFAGVLTEAEIRDVLAWIKSTWPERERAHQAAISRQEG